MKGYLEKVKNAFLHKKGLWYIFNTIKYKRHFFFVNDDSIKRCLIEGMAYKNIKKRFGHLLKKTDYNLGMKKNDTIWTCWLAGLENATPLSFVCIQRMISLFKDRVVVITLKNYSDYITLPDYIVEKFKKGIISYQHFADIIRTFLLVEYGGTWIDSTVYIANNNLPTYFMDSELFMFYHGGRNTCLDFLNYYISCYSNHPVLIKTKEMLCELYRKSNHEIDYLQMCLMLGIACEVYKESFEKMIKFSDIPVHALVQEFDKPFRNDLYNSIIQMSPVQKLSNKNKYLGTKDSFYDVLINRPFSSGEVY